MEKIIYKLLHNMTEDEQRYLWIVLMSSSRVMSERPSDLVNRIPAIGTWGNAGKLQTIWRRSAINALEWYRFYGGW